MRNPNGTKSSPNSHKLPETFFYPLHKMKSRSAVQKNAQARNTVHVILEKILSDSSL